MNGGFVPRSSAALGHYTFPEDGPGHDDAALRPETAQSHTKGHANAMGAPCMRPKTQKLLSLGVGALGLVLLVMMVKLESEPGAIPLALLLLAAAGYITGRMRERPSKRE